MLKACDSCCNFMFCSCFQWVLGSNPVFSSRVFFYRNGHLWNPQGFCLMLVFLILCCVFAFKIQHCVCCISVSLCSANPCKKCGLGRKEHLGWLHNSLLHLCTTLHKTSYIHQLNSIQSEVKLSHFCTTLQTTFFARHLKSTLSNPTQGVYSRVHRCPWVTMPLEFYQLLLTKMLSQSRPAKAEISMGPLPWCCFALNQCDWNWPTPQHKLRKTLTHWKPVKIVIVIEHQSGTTILNAT